MRRLTISSFGILGCVLLAAGFVGAARAAVICVSPAGGGCETTVQAGVDAALAGDTVRIDPGRYDENVTIPVGKDGLVLQGNGGVIDADLPNTGVGITVASANVTLDGVELRNGKESGVFGEATATGLVITDSVLQNFGSDANEPCVRIAGDGARVERSTIEGCEGAGVLFQANDTIAEANRLAYARRGVRAVGNNHRSEKNKSFLIESDGVRVEGDGAEVVGNSSEMLGNDGVHVVGDDFLIEGNKAKNIDSDVIEVTCAPCPIGGVLRKNTGKDAAFGEFIDGGKDPGGTIVIDKNKATRVVGGGLNLFGDGWNATDNTLVQVSRRGCLNYLGSDSTFTGNKCVKSRGGFRFNGDNNTLTDNKVTKSFENGFDVQGGSGNILRENTSRSNVGMGITVRLGATGTTVEDNTAGGNREDFCDAGTGSTVSGNAFGSEFDPMGGNCPTGAPSDILNF